MISAIFIAMFVFVMGNPSTTLAEDSVKSIKILDYANKGSYNLGDPYSTEGLVAEATLADGRSFDYEGWKQVILKYKGVKTSFGITVFDPAKEYKITYNSNAGNKISSKKIDASSKTFELPILKKGSYTFLGWYHSDGYKYTKFTPGMGSNVDLTAKWGITIKYNSNGGSGKMENTAVSKENKLPISKYKKSNLKFVGWTITKDGKIWVCFYTIPPYISGNIKLTPKYEVFVSKDRVKTTG